MTAIKPVIGTPDDDNLNGGNASEVISGRGGDDNIDAGSGHDIAYGGAGNDHIKGQSGNDVLYGSGGPSFVQLTSFVIAEDYEGQIIFEGETAGYRNSLGSYKVAADGTITDVTFHFPNASLQGSGGDLQKGDSSPLSLAAGDQIGFFILANGYSYNDGYSDIDLESGTMEFRNEDGSIATLASRNPSLWHVAADGTETKLVYHAYHTAAGVDGSDFGLNADGLPHTVALLNADAGKVTLGFEDLFNGGDKDYDDSVFTVDVGQSNARVLDPSVRYADNGIDIEVSYHWAYDEAGRLAKYDQDGNFVAYTDQNDRLEGGRGNDELYGRAGHDQLFGDDGVDYIDAGSGDDFADGGAGNDTIKGGKGDDSLLGGSGHDEITGGTGRDTLNGGSGNDKLSGGKDDDIVDGDSGNDHLWGDTGDDQLSGGDGNDHLEGGKGDDTLSGDGGNDTILGGTGNDIINGGAGNDTIKAGSNDDFIRPGANKDVVDGGSGIDTVTYDDASSGVNIDLHKKRTTGGDSDTLKSIENAEGSAYDDYIRGNKLANRLEGGEGDDTLRGMTGEDVLVGGAGSDEFFWRQSDIDGELNTILDFVLGEDAIALDVSASLADKALDEWLMLEQLESSTRIHADLDGDSDFSNSVVLVELDGVVVDDLSSVGIQVA